ncbi:Heat shock protein HSP 90-beta [Cricetulus griseus]|uniref:Heat shock protein HSP 90-beta n=1 Tax=Cricetulus griseus TaxID=10029 RepID=G3I5A9_CRIGR|nr:Heat shock protein HSP 90-beta [Cricetulus griseus]
MLTWVRIFIFTGCNIGAIWIPAQAMRPMMGNSENINEDSQVLSSEINLNHPIVETLRQKTETDKNEKAIKELVVLLIETVLFSWSFSLEDPQSHLSCVCQIVKLGLGIDDDEVTAEEPSDAVPDEISPNQG